MPRRFAFMGFRHGHIVSLYQHALKHDDTEVVAACEEHAETREDLAAKGTVEITHDSYTAMLDSVDCDIVAVGDYYGKRGQIEIEALKRGKHVIADKPLCASLEEITEIERLSSESDLVVGCMLTMRGSAVFATMRKLIQDGELGHVHAISFGGQHPLSFGSRPSWYFEEGKHGGTINDIGIHAIDTIPWMTGLRWATINAARNWNARLKEVPYFQDSAQMMLTMDNGCGVLGDVSYLMPDKMGYASALYWRMTVWGDGHVMEANTQSKHILLCKNDEPEPRHIDLEPSAGSYLGSFLQEIDGHRDGLHLSSEEVLRSSRIALTIQDAANRGLSNVTL